MAGNALAGGFDAFGEGVEHAGDVEGRASAEEDHVAGREVLVAEHAVCDVHGVREVRGLQRGERGALEAHGFDVGEGDAAFGDASAGDVPDAGVAGDGEFVEAVVAVEHEGAFAAKAGKGLGDFGREGRVVDSDDLARCAGGVGEWAQQVEDGGETQGLAGGCCGSRGGVVVDGEAEADADIAQARGLLRGRGVDVDTEGFKELGAAAAGAALVAVLGDQDAGFAGGWRHARGDDSGDGGDVEGLWCTACAAGVDDDAAGGVCRDGREVGAHRPSAGDEFLDADAALLDHREPRADVGGIEASGEKFAKEESGFVRCQGASGDKGGEDGVGGEVSHELHARDRPLIGWCSYDLEQCQRGTP